MNYAKLNPLVTTLPQSAQLADGTWVSNYDKLPEPVLLKEGWLPCDEVKPVYPVTQTLVLDTAGVVNSRVVITYKAVDIPVVTDEMDAILTELEGLT